MTRRWPRISVLVLLATAGAATVAVALDPKKAVSQYQLDAWTNQDGLPQGSVLDVFQDSRGFLWLATQEGIARFDGLRFQTFNGRQLGLQANVFNSFAEDHDGAIWAGSEGGVARMMNTGEVLGVLTVEDGLSSNNVRTLTVDSQGVLWIGTSQGLHRFAGGQLETWTVADGLPGPTVWCIAEEGDGLWVGTSHGLVLFQKPAPLQQSPLLEQRRLTGNGIHSILVERGHLWVGAEDGLYRMEGGQFTLEALAGVAIYSLTRDRDGNLWAGTRGKGLYRLYGQEVEAVPYRAQHASGIVRDLYEDPEGHLWIGTGDDGLWRLRDSAIKVFGLPEGLAHEKAYTVFEDRAETLWIGTFGGGAHRVSEIDGQPRIERFSADNGLPSDHVWSFAEDQSGNLWIGTYGGGVSQRRPDGSLRTLSTADGLSNNYIRAILEDTRGDLWIGTRSGLHRLRGGNPNEIIVYTDGDEGSLLNDSVYTLLESQDGKLHVGTYDGVATYSDDKDNGDTGSFTFLTTADGLSHQQVYALYEDMDRYLWIGTAWGLNRFQPQTGELRTFTSRDGLFDNLVYTILEDDAGNFWLSCNRGIYRVSRNQLNALAEGRISRVKSTIFGTSDGMRNREANGGSRPAGWKRRDGRLVFPTLSGAVLIDPGGLNEVPPAPPVVVEATEVDGHHQSSPNLLTIPPESKRVVFRFAAPSFIAPEKVRYRYRLANYEEDWVDAGGNRTAVYTHMIPGRYRFQVSARHDGGEWGATAELPMIWQPRFYETRWFFALALGLVAATLFGAHHLRVQQIMQRKAELRRHAEEAIAQIKILEGLLPICLSCKKIRDKQGDWSQLETYIDTHSEASFSHGLCPDCTQNFMQDHQLKARQKPG